MATIKPHTHIHTHTDMQIYYTKVNQPHIFWCIYAVTYPGCLGDQCAGLGSQTLVHKKHSSSFLFSTVFVQNICWSSDQWFHNTSNYFEMA